MAKINPSDKSVVFPVPIPAALAADFQLKAGEQVSIAEFLVKIAERYSDLPLDDDRGFYVSGRHRARIEKAFSKAMQAPEQELVSGIENLTRFKLPKIGNLKVDADLLERATAKDIRLSLGEEDYDPTEWWQEMFTLFLNKLADGEIG